MPANFKTYEAQSRLLAALIASMPSDVKIDYKKISAHYGSDRSACSLEHFFRTVKKNAKTMQNLVKDGKDPKDFKLSGDDSHFGDSTHEGIGYQFRFIKQHAELLRQAVSEGKNPSGILNPGSNSGPKSVHATPSKTPRKRAATATPSSSRTPAAKKSRIVAVQETPSKKRTPVNGSEDDTEADSIDYEQLDADDQPPVRTTAIDAAAYMLHTGYVYGGGAVIQEATPSEENYETNGVQAHISSTNNTNQATTSAPLAAVPVPPSTFMDSSFNNDHHTDFETMISGPGAIKPEMAEYSFQVDFADEDAEEDDDAV